MQQDQARNGARRSIAALVAALLVVALASALVGARGASTAGVRTVATAASTTRPNVLLIVADDEAQSTYNRTLMPNVFSQLVDHGVSFDDAYVNTSLCCPSRSQMFTGLYATDTNVSSNFDQLTRPTLVQAMHDDGYRTMIAGKYLNSHPCEDVRTEFDDWYCYGGGNSGEKDPVINVNGTQTPFTGYSPDILAGFVSHFIATTPSDQPFFAMYTPKDPHAPADDDRFDDLPVPTYRPPNFDEDTTADNQPQQDRRVPFKARDLDQIDANYRDMYRSSRGLDGAVGSILSSLGPRADNTLVIYISDNGFFYGEHRKVQGKVAPYQESVNVPMVVRDPQLRPTSDPLESQALVENVDIPATIAERAGIEWHTDGKSFAPILDGSASTIREHALLEHCIAGAGSACWKPGQHTNQGFIGVVTNRYKYIEYDTGEHTLYDLAADPYEMANHAGDPDWAATQSELASDLADLRASPPVDTTIVTGPQGTVAPGTQTFTYFSPPIDATYACRLSDGDDPGPWEPCDSQSTTVGPLDPGTYTFAVAGTENGDTDATPAQRTFTVDDTLPTISVGDASANESAATADRHLAFTVSLSHPANRAVKVSYRTDDGTAESGHDFTAKNGVVTIAANQTSKTVIVPVANDALHEASETMWLRLRNPVGGVLDDASGTGTILDDDPLPKVSVQRATAVEGTGTGGTLEFPVKLSVPSGLPVTVHVRTEDGSAKIATGPHRPSDYTELTDVVRINPGQRSILVPVALTGDALSENDEKLTFALSIPSGATLGTTTSAVGTITDDDPVPALSVGDANVIEPDAGHQTTMSFPVTLSAPAGRPVTVAYTTVDGTATAPDDYIATSGVATVKASQTTTTITVPVVGDNATEGDEDFGLVLSAPLHATINTGTATGTVLDDESPPQVSIADTSAIEGDTGTTPADFTVSLSVPSTHTVTVTYATADGTATAPDDYTATTGTVTFAPGVTERHVAVDVVGDTLVEPDETFTVTLTDPTHATLGTATATGTILDDDSRPSVSVADSPDVPEGDSGTTDAVFTVSLDAPSPRDVSVDYTTLDDTATAPDDYLATSGSVTVPHGSTSATVSVPVVGDTRYENRERFSLVISNPVNGTLGTDTAAAAIVDDDPLPTITLLGDAIVPEGDSGTTDAVFTAQLSSASGLPTTVHYGTDDVTAVAPGDYTATSGAVTIDPGETSATFTVPVKGDTLYEGDERFLVTLTNATNGAISDDDYGGYGIITDDDAPPAVSVADPVVTEGDSGTTDAHFTISIPAPTGLDTRVGYSTVDGSATAPDDYEATADIATIPAGSTEVTVTVAVNGDTLVEGDESFSLVLSDPLNATLGTDTAPATILDDDTGPTIAVRARLR